MKQSNIIAPLVTDNTIVFDKAVPRQALFLYFESDFVKKTIESLKKSMAKAEEMLIELYLEGVKDKIKDIPSVCLAYPKNIKLSNYSYDLEFESQKPLPYIPKIQPDYSCNDSHMRITYGDCSKKNTLSFYIYDRSATPSAPDDSIFGIISVILQLHALIQDFKDTSKVGIDCMGTGYINAHIPTKLVDKNGFYSLDSKNITPPEVDSIVLNIRKLVLDNCETKEHEMSDWLKELAECARQDSLFRGLF